MLECPRGKYVRQFVDQVKQVGSVVPITMFKVFGQSVKMYTVPLIGVDGTIVCWSYK